MPKIVWFALGAIAGAAYATRVIDKERLDLPPEIVTRPEPPKEDPKHKAARLIQQRADRLAALIIARGELLGVRVAERGRELAERLAGKPAAEPLPWLPENELRSPAAPYGEHHTPVVTPEMGYTPGMQQIDQGFELNR